MRFRRYLDLAIDQPERFHQATQPFLAGGKGQIDQIRFRGIEFHGSASVFVSVARASSSSGAIINDPCYNAKRMTGA